MYYGLIILSVLMFGGCFALQDVYRKMRGSGLCISLESSLVGAVAGFLVLFVANGLRMEFIRFPPFRARAELRLLHRKLQPRLAKAYPFVVYA